MTFLTAVPSIMPLSVRFLSCLTTLLVVGSPSVVVAQNPASFTSLDEQFRRDVLPLLKAACLDCHSTARSDGELDLERFPDLAAIRQDNKPWQRVIEMLSDGEMPPKDAEPLSAGDRQKILDWTQRYLDAEALASAGDPGPVVLRRLSNAEYNYTIQDLTGIDTLDPTREFPVDGAAGEGFTNVGEGQTFSSSMVQKYLDAAKQVAAHAVLLPRPIDGDGPAIRFSQFQTRRDWTDERLQQIRAFYGRYTESRGPTETVLPGVTIHDQAVGFLPIERYLRATVRYREAIENGQRSLSDVAGESGLSETYLTQLWTVLHQDDSNSFLLDRLRQRWNNATLQDVNAIASEVSEAQTVLWKFNPIGHLGREGAPQRWMEPTSILTEQLKLDHAVTPKQLILSVVPIGNRPVTVRISDARITFDDGRTPPLPLHQLGPVAERASKLARSELAQIDRYLDGLQELGEPSPDPASNSVTRLASIAEQRALRPAVLQGLAELAGLRDSVSRTPTHHLPNRIERAHGYDAINGWQGREALSVLTNRSDQPITFLTLTVPPRGVTLHPMPNESAVVSWQAPDDGTFRVTARTADADHQCGNGYQWHLEQVTELGRNVLADGIVDNGQRQAIELEQPLRLRTGDVVSLVIGPRDGSHACDTTQVELTLLELGGSQRRWDLASEVVDRILQGNPLADSFGNTDVWHFTSRLDQEDATPQRAPLGSALQLWVEAFRRNLPEPRALARQQFIRLASQPDREPATDADRQLRDQLTHWRGPLGWLQQVRDDTTSAGPIEVSSSQSITIDVPQQMAGGQMQLVGTASIVNDPEASADQQAAQLFVDQSSPDDLVPTRPILVTAASRNLVERAVDSYRNLFPPAPCYARIVPVDEVVTLVLFHREDDHFKRLLLNDDEIRELDRLWNELIFVSQEPLQSVVAYEQITEFATQDRPDLVVAFKPYGEVVQRRAEVFRQQLRECEPFHLQGVVELADRAWRRPVTPAEKRSIQSLYQTLRQAEVSHEDAIRLTIARILTSPTFLYRLESQPVSNEPRPVNDRELATRLSFFLWSSLPDHQLRELADHDELAHNLSHQTQRLLRDSRTRRLAVEFAMQWLHLRLLDQTEKNEQLFPNYASLRDDMREESIRFFEDMFRNDGSILDLIDSDHTFLNEALAKHYGIDGVSGEQWRRVTGVQAFGRGGLLGMASVLSSQSGVSRTSPILRGNWIYETLLGKRLPRPPANVPTLPESVPDGLTSRQLIELHSSAPQCAKCHHEIDPYGFALEAYDTTGRLRDHAVDTSATLPERAIDGIDELKKYLQEEKQEIIVTQFCRKLLGYAIGREVQLSDRPLLQKMKQDLAENDYRFSVAVEAIVNSQQFQTIRGQGQE